MKPDKKPKDYCKTCIYRFNELLGNPWPCNICIGFNEYIPEDEYDNPGEFGSLDDPRVWTKVLDIIDNLICQIDNLERLLPGLGVEDNASRFSRYLTSVKRSIIECYVLPDSDNIDLGGPCFDGEGNQVDCDTCTKDTCPYRR